MQRESGLLFPRSCKGAACLRLPVRVCLVSAPSGGSRSVPAPNPSRLPLSRHELPVFWLSPVAGISLESFCGELISRSETVRYLSSWLSFSSRKSVTAFLCYLCFRAFLRLALKSCLTSATAGQRMASHHSCPVCAARSPFPRIAKPAFKVCAESCMFSL